MKRILCAALLLAGCAYSSAAVEETGQIYRIQSHAALVRGGTTTALGIAHQDAQAFCEKQGRHAVVVDTDTGPWNVVLRLHCVS